MNHQRKTMVAMANEYLAYRRQLGFQLKIEGQQLLQFAKFVDGLRHDGSLTTEVALQWARLPANASQLYQARRLEVVRCFAKYLAIFDDSTEIPPAKILGKAHRRVRSHIYSQADISALFDATESLLPKNGIRPLTFRVLIGLLYSTGLRVSEAFRLKQGDVDFNHGILRIVETKFKKSRLVPVHSSTKRHLEDYSAFRDRYIIAPQSSHFFLTEKGTPLIYSTVRSTFRTLRMKAGLKSNGERPYPRLYDFRHTFACRRLAQWYRDGIDIDHAISNLSTYLGHVKVTDTYWYLTGIPELMQLTVERFERFGEQAGKERDV